MRAVWSFWTKPFIAHTGRTWNQPKHHLYAWGLSLRLARQHYPDTLLVTDTPGKELLVNRLGLEFGEVTTELDRLRHADQGWWALGKLVAYSMQERPFIHLDTDVFLWRALPAWLTAAPVFGQCPEDYPPLECGYVPGNVERAFATHKLSLPVEWEWARSRSDHFREVNTGIVGGTRVDFLRYYANLAVDLVLNAKNASAWAELTKDGCNMLVEQFLLAACVDFHRIAPDSPFRSIGIRYLFPGYGAAFNEETAALLGFTHLLGYTKTNAAVGDRLEHRIASMDPHFHRHCQRVAQFAVGSEV